MKKASSLFVSGAIAALLPLGAALAQSTDPPAQTPPAQGQGATFESLDTNGDGRISKDEAAANETVSQQFSRYDVNGDGFIERAEVSQANDARSQTPRE